MSAQITTERTAPSTQIPASTAGLRYEVRVERFDRPGSRRPGQRLRFEVFDGDQWLVTHDTRRDAERHVAGKPIIRATHAHGFELWTGAQFASSTRARRPEKPRGVLVADATRGGGESDG
ncbi:MAG TPA: hypothetical protein VGV59_03395 [Pyrinomonadaceae bacterium]|nr:hypothetical protein [Pyrinomonadaceae bacterium]